MSIETLNAISDLRKLLDDVTKQKATGQLSQETAAAVRRSLLNLRRAHVKLRESQSESAKGASDAIEQFKKARLQLENSRFLESQCQYLSEKYESTQTPELDKVSVYLPTVEEFTRDHSGEHDFVSYEADPHQFMLAMLSNELNQRKKLEESISSLESTRDTLQSQITKKQKFLSSMSSKLSELTKSVSSIKALFPVASESVTSPTAPIPFADQLSATPQLFIIAGKFWSTLPHTAMKVDSDGDVRELMVGVSPLPSSSFLAPSGTSLEVQLTFRQKQSDPNVTLSVTPQGIYPTLLEDITSASVPVDTVVDNIRGAVLHLMWSAY
jgi:predicted  nucleic acid-binding Zn-ribbon protein